MSALWKLLAGSYQQTDSLSDPFSTWVLILLPFETHTRILHLWVQQKQEKRFLYYQSLEWNILQQYSPRQLYLTKFTSCFGDLAHRQGVSSPSLIWSGAAAALDFWTVSPCSKFHCKFPLCLPHFPDHQLLNAKHNTCPTIQLLWWWHANFCNKCTTQIVELPAHQLLQENSPGLPKSFPMLGGLRWPQRAVVGTFDLCGQWWGHSFFCWFVCQIVIWGFLLLGWVFSQWGKKLL